MDLTEKKRTYHRIAAGRTAQSQVGEVAEQIRALLNSKYDAVPPNLASEFQQDGTVIITGSNAETGLNVQITVRDLGGQGIAAPAPGGPAGPPPAGGEAAPPAALGGGPPTGGPPPAPV